MARTPKRIPEHLLANARRLRRQQTDAEQFLWYLLRNRAFGGFKFRRQYPVYPYILDFYCHEQRLAIELDGGQHQRSSSADDARDRCLQRQGIRMLRLWNNQLLAETGDALELIWQGLHWQAPTPINRRAGAPN